MTMLRLLAILLLVLGPQIAAATCVGNDTYSNMICAQSGLAHYWRMDTASSGTDEVDHDIGIYANAAVAYVNTADVTVQTASIVANVVASTDKSVTFGGAAVNPGFAVTNSASQKSFSPHLAAGGGTTGIWSLEFWFKASSLTNNQNLFSVADSSQYNWRLTTTSGPGSTLRFQIHGSAGTCGSLGAVLDVNSSSTLSTATVYYVVLQVATHASTWDSFAMYINNSLENSTTPSGGECGTDHRLYFAIEGQDRNNPFAGVLDEVVLYDALLTTQERIDHYAQHPNRDF
jgi:hypothetical protein